MNHKFHPLYPYVAYYMHLDKNGVITKLQYRFRKHSIVYGIRCVVNEMLYVGSTSAAGLRFDNHLISGVNSNASLQRDIAKYGLSNFIVYVFEVVSYPDNVVSHDRKAYLHSVEQSVMNRFPKTRLYNIVNATSKL